MSGIHFMAHKRFVVVLLVFGLMLLFTGRYAHAIDSPSNLRMSSSYDTAGQSNSDGITYNTNPFFEWSKPTGTYQFQWVVTAPDGFAGNYGDRILEGFTSLTYHQPGYLSSNGSYKFWVQAWNGGSEWSAWVGTDYTIDTAPPSQPSGLDPSGDISTVRPTLTWNASSDGTGSGIWRYRVRVWEEVWGYPVIYDEYINDTSVTLPSGELGWEKTYGWNVQAIDVAGNGSTYNNNKYITPNDTTNPSAPTNLTFSPQWSGGWTNDPRPKFTWADSVDNESGIRGYKIWITNSQVSNHFVREVQTPEWQLIPLVEYLVEGTNTISIAAVNNAGLESTKANVVASLDTTPPSQPAGLNPSGLISTVRPTLTWNESSDGDGSGFYQYRVRVWKGFTGSPIIFNEPVDGTSVTLTSDLEWESDYGWNVQAIDIVGNSVYSTDIYFKPHDTTSPSAPTNLTFIPQWSGGWTNDPRPKFTWADSVDNESGIRGYKIWITNSQVSNHFVREVQTPEWQLIPLVEYLVEGTNTISIAAVNNAGLESTKANVVASLDTTPPSQPAGLNPSGLISTVRPTLTWNESSDGDGSGFYQYRVRVWKGFTGSPIIFNEPVDGTSVTLTSDLEWESDYGWNVQAIDVVGNSIYSSDIYFKPHDGSKPTISNVIFNQPIPGDGTFSIQATITDEGGSGLNTDSLMVYYRHVEDPLEMLTPFPPGAHLQHAPPGNDYFAEMPIGTDYPIPDRHHIIFEIKAYDNSGNEAVYNDFEQREIFNSSGLTQVLQVISEAIPESGIFGRFANILIESVESGSGLNSDLSVFNNLWVWLAIDARDKNNQELVLADYYPTLRSELWTALAHANPDPNESYWEFIPGRKIAISFFDPVPYHHLEYNDVYTEDGDKIFISLRKDHIFCIVEDLLIESIIDFIPFVSDEGSTMYKVIVAAIKEMAKDQTILNCLNRGDVAAAIGAIFDRMLLNEDFIRSVVEGAIIELQVQEEITEELKDTIINGLDTAIDSFYNVQFVVACANLALRGLTFISGDMSGIIELEHRDQTPVASVEFLSPGTASDANNELLPAETLVSNLGGSVVFKVKVTNETQQPLQDVWIALDIHAPYEVLADGTNVADVKVENTLTLIEDSGPGGTGEFGNIRWKCTEIDEVILPEPIDQVEDYDEIRVNIPPGGYAIFESDPYPLTTTTHSNPHTYYGTIYTTKYRAYTNGYPGKTEGILPIPLTGLEKRNFALVDTIDPIWPIPTEEHPTIKAIEGDGQISLAWDAAEMWNGTERIHRDLARYLVYYSTNENDVYDQEPSLALDALLSNGTAKMAELTNGTAYYFGVAVQDYSGRIVYSPIVEATPISGAILSVGQSELTFFVSSTANSVDAQNVSISNLGTGDLSWDASADQAWIVLDGSGQSASGTAPSQLSVSILPSELPTGESQGTITITAAGAHNSPAEVSINVTKTAAPLARLEKSSLSFTAQEGDTTVKQDTVIIFNDGEEGLNWSITIPDQAHWLTADPMSGTNDQTITFTANPTGLGVGSFHARVAFDSNAANGTQYLDVYFSITSMSTHDLTVSVDPSGGGSVTSNPAGISCPGNCTQSYTSNTQVILTPTADADYEFDHWSGCDSVNGSECTMIMNSAKAVTAYFICAAINAPANSSPADGATDVPIVTDLDWDDSNGATSYDVYFGVTSLPPKVGTVASSSYNLGILDYDTHYYWQIVAKNSCGNNPGPVWEFTTSEEPSPGVLSVLPLEGLNSSGPEGGPFSPPSKDYTLENTGGTSIDWTASKNEDWIDLSKTGGILSSGAIDTVTVSINSNADILSEGTYNGIVTFTNITNGNIGGPPTRGVNLNVISEISPVIDSISPPSGSIGTQVTITGSNFGASQGSGYVTFYDGFNAAEIASWTGTEIVCTVPDGAQTGCVTVTTDEGTSNCVVFTVEEGPSSILWDQPASNDNITVYACQDFETANDNYDIWIADDFTNTENWHIEGIYIPGNTWNTGCDLTCATSLNFQIYNDNSGVPNGYPDGGLGGAGTPLWNLSVTPGDSQVTLSLGVGGYLSDVTLSLNTPINLQSGTYWLIFYPEMPISGCCQYGRHVSGTKYGYVAKVINPGGGAGFSASWTSVQDPSTWALTEQDFAFRLFGNIISEGGIKAMPWLQLLLLDDEGSVGPVEYDLSDYEGSMTTYASWTSDIREGYTGFIGEGRGGYYFSGHADYVEIGWCCEALCNGYNRIGLEIFNFTVDFSPEAIIPAVLRIHTYTPDTESWYSQVGFDVYINDVKVGSGISAERGSDKISEILIEDQSIIQRGTNNIYILYNEDRTGSSYLTRVDWVELVPCSE